MKTFFFHSANLTDCFFTAESEEIVSLLQKVKMFFFRSANLRDYFFILKNKQIGFFTAESEDILFPQCQFNRFFTAESEEIVSSLRKVKMSFFRSEK